MSDQHVFRFLKTNSLNNNTQLRSAYEAIKTEFVKKGEATDDIKKMALFLAAKKIIKLGYTMPEEYTQPVAGPQLQPPHAVAGANVIQPPPVVNLKSMTSEHKPPKYKAPPEPKITSKDTIKPDKGLDSNPDGGR